MLRIATAHLPDETMYYAINDSIEYPDRKMTAAAFDKVIGITETDTKKQAVRDSAVVLRAGQRQESTNWLTQDI